MDSWKRVALMALLFWAVATLAGAQKTVSVYNGFMTVQKFLEEDELFQRAYAVGFMNGVYMAPFIFINETSAKPESLDRLAKCTAKMNDVQLAAILRKYFSDRPQEWHQLLNAASFSAIMSVCPRR